MSAPDSSQELNSYNTASVTRGDQAIFSDADGGNIIKRDSAEEISRLQSAINDYSASLTYEVGDVVKQAGQLFRCITQVDPAEAFDPAKWEQFSALQGAYDFGEDIKIADADGDSAIPVNIIAPDPPVAAQGEYDEVATSYIAGNTVTVTTNFVLTWRNVIPITAPAGPFDETKWLLLSIFQPVISVEDLNGNLPLRIEGGGEIEQVPFNLKTASITRAGDNGAILLEGRILDIHSRFLFVTQDPAVGLGAIEIFSIANPEEPESVGLVTDALIDSPIIIRMFGDILYVIAAQGGVFRLLLFDIGNPSDPKLLNTGGFASGVGGVEFDGRNDMVLQGKYLFLGRFGQDAGTSFITILDVSDPTNIQLVSSIADGTDNGDGAISLDQPRTFVVHENFLYVGNQGTDSVELIDISDITLPQFVSTITNNGTTIRLVDPSMMHATRDVLHVISNADKTLQAIDYRVPTAPTPRGQLIDAFGVASSSDIGGRYLYVLSRDGTDKIITTIDLQDADNLVKLSDSIIAGTDVTLTPTDIAASGDHAFGLASNEELTELYSIRLSGIDSQSCRIGEARFGNIDVKDDFSGRQGDFSESLHVGTRGILSNGPISGQDSSNIVRRVIDETLTSGAQPSPPFLIDMNDDVTEYFINGNAINQDWTFDITNVKPGHRVTIHLTLNSNKVTFPGLKYFTAGALTDEATVDSYIQIEANKSDGSTDSILLLIWDEN